MNLQIIILKNCYIFYSKLGKITIWNLGSFTEFVSFRILNLLKKYNETLVRMVVFVWTEGPVVDGGSDAVNGVNLKDVNISVKVGKPTIMNELDNPG